MFALLTLIQASYLTGAAGVSVWNRTAFAAPLKQIWLSLLERPVGAGRAKSHARQQDISEE